MLSIAVWILIVAVILLAAYIIFLQRQLRGINRQLKKRLKENTRQPLNLELLNRELNHLAVNVNKCLKAEETLRLNSIREEKQFKELIANISHDLRTPLTAIKGYQQLMEKSELSDDQQRKLKIARKHTDELGSLIENFFEYSRLVNAESEPELEKLNLTNLAAESLAAAIAIFEESNLSVHYKEVLPVFIFANKEMMIRILQNLIRNCEVHSAGNITVSIVTNGGRYAILSFKNPVNKASELDADRLFERFYIADKARSKTAGLGLSIVKLLAEQMRGKTEAFLNGDELEVCIWLPLYQNE